jgi:hypothetical protein
MSDRTPPPAILPLIVANLPLDDLAPYRQFVTWSSKRRGNRWTKPPKNPHTGAYADCGDPGDSQTWGAWEDVFPRYDRVGFVLTWSDPFTFLDVDNGVTAGAIKPWAQQIVDRFPSYWEYSPSGTGLKGLIVGQPPLRGTGTRNRIIPAGDGKVEIFFSGKFTTLTGHQVASTSSAITDCQAALDHFCAEASPEPTLRSIAPSPALDLNDEAIIERVQRMAKGRQLHDAGDVAGYESGSEADLGLLNCYVSAGATDPAQLDRLYRRSALYADRAEKWDQRKDYRERTIARALDGHVVSFQPPTLIRLIPPRTPTPSDDPCRTERDELAELRAEIAQLRRQLAVTEQYAAERDYFEKLYMATARVLRNPNLRPGEKMVGLSLIVEVEDAARRGRTDEGGWAEVLLERLAERAGCAAGTAGKHVDRVAAAGVVESKTKPIPGKRHARRVARFPVADVGDDAPAPTLADRLAILANAAPERDDKGWGGDRRCPDHPNAGTIITTTTVVACEECGQIIGEPVTRRRRTRPIVTQDAALSAVAPSETREPRGIVVQDARLSPELPTPIVIKNGDQPLSTVSEEIAEPIVTQDAALSPRPAPRPGGVLERVKHRDAPRTQPPPLISAPKGEPGRDAWTG